MKNAYKIFIGKSERKRPIGRPRHKWQDNIKMDHKEIRHEGVDWFPLAQDGVQHLAAVNMVMNLQVP
jgi:hypothetical protein